MPFLPIPRPSCAFPWNESAGRENLAAGEHGVLGKGQVLDHNSSNEMFLDDTFQVGGGAGMIPDPFWINHRKGPAQTYPQAIRLGSINQGLRTREFQLLQPLLEEFPRFQPFLPGAAFSLALVGAEKDMSFILLQSVSGYGGFEVFGLVHGCASRLVLFHTV